MVELNTNDATVRALLTLPIRVVQVCLTFMVGADQPGFFGRAIGASFFLFWVFLIALTLLSIRRRSSKMLLYCAAGMVVGYFTLHILAWLAVSIVVIIGGLIFAVGWAGSAVAAAATYMTSFVGMILSYAWPLLLVGVCLYLGWRYLEFLAKAMRRLVIWLQRHFARIALVAVAVALVVFLVPLIYRWVLLPFYHHVLVPVFGFLWMVVSWVLYTLFLFIVSVVAILLVLISVALIGSLLASQLQSGWRAAKSIRDMLVAGFSIGSSLTLIVLVSLATPALASALNHAWAISFLFEAVPQNTAFLTDTFTSTLPTQVRAFAFAHLTDLQAPGFDTFVFLIVMVFSLFSVLVQSSTFIAGQA